jgi:hypothetical protein
MSRGHVVSVPVALEVGLTGMPAAAVRLHDQAPERDIGVNRSVENVTRERKLSGHRRNAWLAQDGVEVSFQDCRRRLVCVGESRLGVTAQSRQTSMPRASADDGHQPICIDQLRGEAFIE